jgi:ATP-dependent RNA/DNA helicase IGHMBP2
VRHELQEIEAQYRKARDGERKALRGEEKKLRAEIRQREDRVISQILRSADVVLATNTGAATKSLQRALHLAKGAAGGGDAAQYFDVVVIDEVAQATEASCFIPALLGGKLVIAGDHLQLPPTVMSEEAASAGLSFTLADRVAAKFPAPDSSSSMGSLPSVVCMLDVQYRMHATIMKVWALHCNYCALRCLRFAPTIMCNHCCWCSGAAMRCMVVV